jgi:hypothetical protein
MADNKQSKTILADMLLAANLAGRTTLVGMYMGLKGKAIEYTSKKTGKKELMKVVTHLVIQGSGTNVSAIQVEEIVENDVDLATVKPPVGTGKGVMLYVAQKKEEMGHVSVRVEKNGLYPVELPEAA